MNGGRDYRARLVTTAVCRVALVGILLVLIVIAYFPFTWSPPAHGIQPGNQKCRRILAVRRAEPRTHTWDTGLAVCGRDSATFLQPELAVSSCAD